MNISIIDHFIINDAGKIITGRAFWNETSISQPTDIKSMDVFIDDFKDRG